MPGTPPASVAAQTNPIFNPGFYLVDFSRGTSLAEVIAMPEFRGALRGFTWRELEPSYGSYDFSAIDQSLTDLQGNQLIITVRLKNFSNTTPYTPSYMDNNIATYGGGPNTGGSYLAGKGIYAAIWNQNVLARFQLLANAIGAAYGDDVQFEGVYLHETAWRWSEAKVYPDFNQADWEQAFYDMADYMKAALPRQQIFQATNFNFGGSASVLTDFRQYLVDELIPTGCPDTIPGDPAITPTYEYIDSVRNDLATFPQQQWNNYTANEEDGNSTTDVFNWVKTNMRCWYFGYQKREPYWSDHVLNIVQTEQFPPMAKTYYSDVTPPPPGDTLTGITVTPAVTTCEVKVTSSATDGLVYCDVIQRDTAYTADDDVTDGTGSVYHESQASTGLELTFSATGLTGDLPHQIGLQQIDTPAAGQNYLPWSTDLSQWENYRVTITDDLIEGNWGSGSNSAIRADVTLEAGTYCFWQEVKSRLQGAESINEYHATRITPPSVSDGFSFCNVVTNVIGNQNGDVSDMVITEIDDDWCQVYQSFTLAVQTSINFGVYLAQSNTSAWLSAPNDNDILCRHLQVNDGTTPTAKTLTTGTPSP